MGFWNTIVGKIVRSVAAPVEVAASVTKNSAQHLAKGDVGGAAAALGKGVLGATESTIPVFGSMGSQELASAAGGNLTQDGRVGLVAAGQANTSVKQLGQAGLAAAGGNFKAATADLGALTGTIAETVALGQPRGPIAEQGASAAAGSANANATAAQLGNVRTWWQRADAWLHKEVGIVRSRL
ncbi:MAG: hypothetical protein ACYCWW_00130 [Deltaproteobacteria bacterium]